MNSVGMTELQRRSLEHFERSRREGLSIQAYARAYGIQAQQIYDAVGRLRRRGALPDQAAGSGKFIAVEIAPTSIGTPTVCRMLAPGGVVIECLQWPPRSWLESLARTADAATRSADRARLFAPCAGGHAPADWRAVARRQRGDADGPDVGRDVRVHQCATQ
jgi:hypothetical protein